MIAFWASLIGIAQDTTRMLNPVPIYSEGDTIAKWVQIRSSIPHFQINQKQVDDWGFVDVGEALKILPGVQIKDYGGIGGVKTITYRSLGGAHTGVLVDGFSLPAMRTGSVNLSDFELFGLDHVSLSSGNPTDAYATAASYAQANTVALQSILLKAPRKVRLGIYSNATTINAYEHGAYFQKKVGKHFFLGGQGMFRHGSGKYSFVHPEQKEGPLLWRDNSVMLDYRLRIAGGFSDENTLWNASAAYSNSNQELPGAAVLFNSSNDQTLQVENMRLQSVLSHKIDKWDLSIHGGYQNEYSRYYDPYYQNLQGFIDVDFTQDNLNAGFMMRRTLRNSNEKLFFGTELIQGALSGNELILSPKRISSVTVVGGKTIFGRVKFEANLTAQIIADRENSVAENPDRNYHRFSPFVSVAYLPIKKEAFRIRSFYRHAFRMPSFNDLYYNFIGNINLNPEDAHLFNIGITYGKAHKRINVEFTADAYYNRVANKIVAIPTKDLFNWSMQNIGETEIKGIDIGGLFIHQFKNWKLDLNLSHSFNESIDITNPESLTFGHQIPYTPYYHSQSSVNASRNGYRFGITALFTGFRYSLNENIYANYLPGFADINLGLSKQLDWGKGNILIDVKAMNILNNNYQVIRSFPMPGRHYQLRIKYRLDK